MAALAALLEVASGMLRTLGVMVPAALVMMAAVAVALLAMLAQVATAAAHLEALRALLAALLVRRAVR